MLWNKIEDINNILEKNLNHLLKFSFRTSLIKSLKIAVNEIISYFPVSMFTINGIIYIYHEQAIVLRVRHSSDTIQ